MRWFTPIMFFGAAASVYYVNSTYSDRVLVFPMLHVFVGDSVQAQGQLTWQICLGMAVFFTLWSFVDMRRGGHEHEE